MSISLHVAFPPFSQPDSHLQEVIWPSRDFIINRFSTNQLPNLEIPNPQIKLLTTNSSPCHKLSSSLITALMESSSMSSSGSLRKRGPTQCFCSERPVLVVSWTPENPGRRFYECPNYWVSQYLYNTLTLFFPIIHDLSLYTF